MLERKKKFTDVSNSKYEIYFSFMKNRRMLIVAGLLVFLWNFFSVFTLKQSFDQHHVTFCELDGFVVMDAISIKGWVLFPIAIYMFSAMLDRVHLQTLIRKKTRTDILRVQFGKICVLAVYLTIVQIVAIKLSAKVMGVIPANWTEQYSVFWMQTGTTLQKSPGEMQVILSFIISCLLNYGILGLIYMVIGFCGGQRYVAYVIELILLVIQIGYRDFIRADGIQYVQWIKWNCMGWIVRLMFCLLLAIVGGKIVKRKDFYGT